MNIIENAKNKIYKSPIMQYVSKERVDEAIKGIVYYANKKDFVQAFGSNSFKEGRLEGFNRRGISYLSPEATTHTVIHEVLHTLSSDFGRDGHRIKNGLTGGEKYNFANQINEGATDYLACQISGEEPRNYIQGHKLFAKLEPMLVKYTNKENILMQVYLNKDAEFIREFMDKFGDKNSYEELYENFLFLNDEKISQMMNKTEKGLNKYIRKQKIIEKIEKVFGIFKNRKIKTLPEAQGYKNENDSKRNDFLSGIKVSEEDMKKNINFGREDISNTKEMVQDNVKESDNKIR